MKDSGEWFGLEAGPAERRAASSEVTMFQFELTDARRELEQRMQSKLVFENKRIESKMW